MRCTDRIAHRRGIRGNRRGGGGRPAATLAGPAICLVLGQSNAMGPSDAMTTPPALPRADVRCSVFVGAVEDGTAPRDLDEFTYRGAEVGLGVTLADAGRNVAISKWVYNATSTLTNWTPWMGDSSGTTVNALLSDAIVQTRTFIEQLIAEDPTRQPYVAGVYWNQWEADASATQSAQYVNMLRVCVERLRAEFHPDLPVFIAKVSNNFAGDIGTYPTANVDNIKAAHTTIAGESALNILVDTDDLAFNVDGIHYTSDAQLELGTDRLAPLVLAAAVPSYLGNSDLIRVSIYTTEAAATTAASGAPVYMSPADNRVWAVEDAAGAHFVPAASWPVAVTKAARWFPNTQALVSGDTIGGTIFNADVGTLNTGQWYMKLRPGFASTDTATRRILHKATAYSIYWLGGSAQFNVRMNSADALSGAITFNGTTDEIVIAVDFGNTVDNVTFYKNGVLHATASQANTFGGSVSAVQLGAVSYATANQWIGEYDEPVVGAYTP